MVIKAETAPSVVIEASQESADKPELAPTVKEAEILYNIKTILSTVWTCLNKRQRFGLIIGFSSALAYAASTPLFAFVFSKLLATLYDPINRKQKALRYSLAILGIACGDAMTIFVAVSRVQCVAQTWVNQIRRKAIRHILDQPREFFDRNENNASKMTECLDQHAEETQHILGRFVGNILIVTVMVLMAVIWSMVSCWKLTLVLFACTPILLLVTGGLSSVGAAMEKHGQDATEHASSIFAETFTGIKTVRTLTLEKHFGKKHSEAADAVLKAGIRKGIYVGVFYGLSQSILLYIIALIFYYGSVLLRQHQFSLNSIMEVFTLLLLSISTATMILASIPQLSASREAAARLLRLASLPKSSHEHEGTIRTPSVGVIDFHNVRFRYPSRPDHLVLKSINLRISTGSCTALVGTSGSGKSTIASLLLKLYQSESTTSADITLSSRDLRQLDTCNLRNLISVVSQTPTLFPTSISGNIVYGLRASDPRNSAQNVRDAALKAGIHDFITSLPDGYDTLIGEGGTGLSGGQAQRIAIARALARRPDVLILDEATSALDVESAAVVRESLQRLLFASRLPGMRPLTVIIITHAREMMELADWVIMMDQGRVVEEGEFEEMIRREGRFAALLRGEAWDRDVRTTKRRSLLLMSKASGVWQGS